MSSESQETSADFSCNAPRDTNNEQSKVSAVESSSQLPNASTALARLANSDLHNLDPKDQEVLFYLSLIEGRCKTQAANSINRGRHHLDWVPDSHPEVVELSRHLFSKISQEFHKAGLLPDKFSGLNLEVVRSKYLTTFDSILQDYATQHAPDLFDRNTDRSISRSNIFSLSEGSSSLALSGALARRQQFTMAEAAQSPSGLHSFQLNLQGNGINERLQSRYKSEYKEGHLIGKGGFGSVYKVENILDEQSYAIKKIKIQGRHLSLMDEQGRVTKMLSELRTLAKLSHQNVVRYYAGWIEAVAARPAIRSNTSSSQGSISFQNMNNTFASNMKRLKLNDRTNNEEFDNSFDPFDRSEPLATVEKLEHPLDSKQSSESGASNRIGFFKQPSSGSIEELERSIPPPDLPILKQDFTLFISMAIHPMNLEHYIWGDNPSGESNIQIQHCFHTSICVRLLLAIISGIQYVHNQGIVHRDLKPSNIFLSVSQGPRTDYEGAIDITGCGGCPGAPPGDRKFITPHIGDFGLAAEMSTEPPPTGNTLSAKPMTLAMVSSQHTQPGTAFYIPPSTDRTICTKLDVYSLGVITFELITKFGTKSERGMVLQRLGRGEFPNNFDQHEMAEGIRGMLCSKREDRWTTGEVKKWLKGIKARHDLV